MPFANSYFNLTLYRKYLTRFWPLWLLYAIIWAFALPLNLILKNSRSYAGANDAAADFANRNVLSMLPEFGLGMAISVGLLTAMAVWSYLYNNRSAALIHSLPIRREGLFFTGFLAGLTFFIVPNAVIFLLTLAAEAMAGTVNLGVLGTWFAAQSLLSLFFFCFGTLCAFLTGHILALPAFYAIFNFLAVGLLALVEYVLQNFVFGFGGLIGGSSGLTGAWPVAKRLSPIYHFTETVRVTYARENSLITNVTFHGMQTIAVYALIGLVLAALALLLYRRRSLERAGEVVAAAWLRPVFKYGIAFCGALAFGSLLYTLFGNARDGNAFAMLAFLLPCGFLCYFAAEMLLQKSFRVFKKSWKGCAVFLLLLLIVTAALEFDITGYEKRIPPASAVEHITLSHVYALPNDDGQRATINAYDGDLIWRIRALHVCTAEHKAAVEQGLQDHYHSDNYITDETGVTIQTANAVSYNLSYTMKNGQVILRRYTIPVNAALLANPTSPAALLLDILNNRENAAADYFPDSVTGDKIIEGAVFFYDENYRRTEVHLTATEAGIVYEAALLDLAQGGVGNRFLLQNMDYYTQVYQNDLSLTFYGIFPGWTTGTQARAHSVDINIQADSVHLIAALEALGVFDESHRLVPQLQQEQFAASEK